LHSGAKDLVVQDQIVGDGASAVSIGDSLEVRYRGCIINGSTGTIGSEFDSNLTVRDLSTLALLHPLHPI
jgi:FKBP-type peptidyl-prolyl cis-trans isomerase